MDEEEKSLIHNYFRKLQMKRWEKDTRTKEERSEYFKKLSQKRWQKRKDVENEKKNVQSKEM